MLVVERPHREADPRLSAARSVCAASRWAALAFALGLLLPTNRVQARRVRPLFEPTDLELEQPGMLEVDLQFGVIRSRGPARVVVPDFEVDVGILPNLELDIDG